MPHRFDHNHLARLDCPERRKLLPPERVLEKIGIRPGDTLLDAGAGTGYFSFPAAGICGPSGSVIAVDASIEMVRELNHRVEKSGLRNILVRLSPDDSPGVPEGTADAALLANMLHETANPLLYLRNTGWCLKPAGRIAVLETRPDAPAGPPQNDRLGEATVRTLLKEAGFVNIVSEPVSETHYLAQAERG